MHFRIIWKLKEISYKVVWPLMLCIYKCLQAVPSRG